MLFNIEYDSGEVIEGYCVPDGYEDEPVLRVTVDGSDLGITPGLILKDAVRVAGRHGTGMVGFRLDETIIPGLPDIKALTIHEQRTGLLIYQRPRSASDRKLKLLRLEAQMLPLTHLDIFCGQHFQYALKSAERFGHETVMQAFHLNAVPSIYLSGRLLLRNYEEFLDKGFLVVICMPDPYIELASRIYLLHYMNRQDVGFLGERDRFVLGNAAEHFADVVLNDRAALRRTLRALPKGVLKLLRSPLTRQLVATSDDQEISRRDVAGAVDMLSRFSIVGSTQYLGEFHEALGELLDLPPASLPGPAKLPILSEIAAQLRKVAEAERLIEEDLVLDHYVRNALAPA